MKALTILSFALALAACLFTFSTFAGSDGSARASGTSNVAGMDAGSDELRAQLASLQKSSSAMLGQLQELDSRLSSLELNPPAALSTRQPVAVEAPLKNSETLEKLAAALESGEATTSNELQTLVLGVIASKEEQERIDREARRLQQTQDRVNERVEKLREELGLNGRQANDMARVLVNEELKRDELFTKMREGGTMDRDSIREGMTQLREGSRTELGQILTPEQYEAYSAMESDRRGWRGDRGGRGGDTNGGGGGRRGGGGGNRDV